MKGSNSSGRKKNNSLKNNKENNVETRDTSSKNKDESGNSIDKPSNTNDTEKEKNEISKLNELSETVIHTDIKLPEELANNKDTDSVSHESTENKKAKKKSKERKNRKDYDNTLDNIFGNGGIIVIAQSLQNPEDVKYS